jgi:hypothetical protein
MYWEPATVFHLPGRAPADDIIMNPADLALLVFDIQNTYMMDKLGFPMIDVGHHLNGIGVFVNFHCSHP